MLYDDNGVGVSRNLLFYVGGFYFSVQNLILAFFGGAPINSTTGCGLYHDVCFQILALSAPLDTAVLLSLIVVKSGPGPISRRARKIHRIEVGESYPIDDILRTTTTPRDSSIIVPDDSQDKVLFYSLPVTKGPISLIKSIWHRIELSDPLKVSLFLIVIFYIISAPFIVVFFYFPLYSVAIDIVTAIQIILCSITWLFLAEF
jgi:hypothetical protein